MKIKKLTSHSTFLPNKNDGSAIDGGALGLALVKNKLDKKPPNFWYQTLLSPSLVSPSSSNSTFQTHFKSR